MFVFFEVEFGCSMDFLFPSGLEFMQSKSYMAESFLSASVLCLILMTCPTHDSYRLLSHFLPDFVLSHIANGSITAMSHAKVNINASIFLIF